MWHYVIFAVCKMKNLEYGKSKMELCNYCSVLDEDLKVWEARGGITKEDFSKGRHRGTHYQILDHRLYREKECMFPFR